MRAVAEPAHEPTARMTKHNRRDAKTRSKSNRRADVFRITNRLKWWRESVGIEPTGRVAPASAVLKTERATRPVLSHSAENPYFIGVLADPTCFVESRCSYQGLRGHFGHILTRNPSTPCKSLWTPTRRGTPRSAHHRSFHRARSRTATGSTKG